MLLNESQREQALATLLQLHSDSPRHGHVLELLSQLHAELEDWRSLLDLVPALRMQKVVSKRQGDALEVKSHLGLLIDSTLDGEPSLQQLWETMPKTMRENVELIGAYVELCLELSQSKSGERGLFDAINRHWDDRLVYLYGMVEGDDPKRQLNDAEKWLAGRRGARHTTADLGTFVYSKSSVGQGTFLSGRQHRSRTTRRVLSDLDRAARRNW